MTDLLANSGADRSRRLDVWINPAAHATAAPFVRVLKDAFHLVVVPKTGTRIADAAVLCDPSPLEVRRVRSILRGIPLVAATSSEPSAALRAEVRRASGLLLTRPSAQELVEAIRHPRRQAPQVA